MNLTVIILTYNESIHVERCIKSLLGLCSRIVIVDSYSDDNTCHLAASLGADIYQNRFVNQAQQFDWALSSCEITSEWVMRIDADELIDLELVENIKGFINGDGYGCNGAIFHRKHVFLGKWVRYGGRYPLPMLRLFRNGKAHIEQRWMDEHIVLDEGSSLVLKGGFEDNNLNPVSWFIDKHNRYATREVVDIMLSRLSTAPIDQISSGTGLAIKIKRHLKESFYMKLPYFFRPFLYFIYRYIFQLGFLDGARGFAYHFMQGFWYRALVDLKCLEVDLAWRGLTAKDDKLKALEQFSGYDLKKFK